MCARARARAFPTLLDHVIYFSTQFMRYIFNVYKSVLSHSLVMRHALVDMRVIAFAVGNSMAEFTYARARARTHTHAHTHTQRERERERDECHWH